MNDTSRGVSRPHRPRLLRFGILLAAGLLLPTPVAAATPTASGPANCVPFGTAQLPPGAPSAGGRAGLTNLPIFPGSTAPTSVEVRTPTTQFNRFWDFALVGHDLLTRPRGDTAPTAEPWHFVPMPECLRGRLVGLSLDDDELVAVDDNGWIYTMDNASQHPLLWNWTSAWGAPLWVGPGRQLPGDRPNGWALSVSSPWDNQTFTDIAGRIHFVGLGKMTMLPALTGDGSRITYADPWLPSDDSYEIGGPLGGRFQADSLSAAGSTTFVMNKYGDMYTRTFDFDSSGSDSIFFRYSWDDQSDKPSAPNLFVESIDRSTAAIQLPATVTAPGGTAIPVVLHTADGLRMTPREPGLDADPRHLVGAIEIPADAYTARGTNPTLDAFVRDWMRGSHIAAITLSATDHDLVVR